MLSSINRFEGIMCRLKIIYSNIQHYNPKLIATMVHEETKNETWIFQMRLFVCIWSFLDTGKY